ncbi:MAG TPA: cytochrome P450 [Solirubrobacteraceae bacterium]|jgi:cytochrome P450|nr:cytochrome P450 [Solirubrobacteraceae bacterium]
MASAPTAAAEENGRVADSAIAAPPRLPPGPRAPAVVQTLAWALAPTWLMDGCSRRLGEAFTLTFSPSGLKLVLVSDPEAVKTVFTAPPEVAPSGAGNSPIAPVMGPSSVIVLTGPEHMRQRKLLLPPFHGERMREYEEVIVEATRRDIAQWPLGRPMRLQERTRAITLEVILRAVFGVEAERMGPLREAIAGLLKPVNPLAIVMIALRRPSLERPTGAIGRALDNLDEVIYEELARRRAQEDLAERRDILSLLMQARDEDGQAMTDGELRDELVTLLLAGHETTATSVAWAIERLVRHPQKLRRLQEEIDGGGEEYMTAVVNETLRVRPVVPIVVRVLQEQLQVGPYMLPAGTRVVPSIYLTNRNPRVYEDAEEFRPERFLDGTPETFSWIPFGGGIRRCIGASFAQLEMRLMLRTMLSELQPSIPGTMWRRGEWVRRRAITLVPAAGARVTWSRRAG